MALIGLDSEAEIWLEWIMDEIITDLCTAAVQQKKSLETLKRSSREAASNLVPTSVPTPVLTSKTTPPRKKICLRDLAIKTEQPVSPPQLEALFPLEPPAILNENPIEIRADSEKEILNESRVNSSFKPSENLIYESTENHPRIAIIPRKSLSKAPQPVQAEEIPQPVQSETGNSIVISDSDSDSEDEDLVLPATMIIEPSETEVSFREETKKRIKERICNICPENAKLTISATAYNQARGLINRKC